MPDEFLRFWHSSSMANGPGATTLYALENAISGDDSLADVPLSLRPKMFALDPLTDEWYMAGMDPSQIPDMFNRYNERLAAQGLPLLPRLGIPAIVVRTPPPPVTVYPIAVMPPGQTEWIPVDQETGKLTVDGQEVHIEPDTGKIVNNAGKEVSLDKKKLSWLWLIVGAVIIVVLALLVWKRK